MPCGRRRYYILLCAYSSGLLVYSEWNSMNRRAVRVRRRVVFHVVDQFNSNVRWLPNF